MTTENLEYKLRILRANTAYQALKHVYVQPKFPNASVPYEFLPILVGGGIGDLIVAIPLIQRIKELIGPVKVWCCNPDVYRYFMGPEDLPSDKYFPGFAYWLKIETAPRFFTNDGDLSKVLSKHMPLVLRWYDGIKRFPEIERFANYQPNFDHELAEVAMEAGLTRLTLPNAVMGFPTSDCTPRLQKKTKPVDLEPFITLHDGFDSTQTDVAYRSSKSWNLRHWARVVEDLRDIFPHHMIVQLGGPMSRPIPGVTVNLVGKCKIEQSLDLLSRSALHIDTESGLVHAAHAMGVKSVVIFGPTPVQFFGYDDNVNLAPTKCGNCWWLTRSWMAQCPLFDQPECVDSVAPHRVVTEAVKAIRGC